ncbi:hypothetical protein GFY24_17720 [Nocardia sp. SYP-A9097]|uniref:hypothetical protein n=1 Tax=Nocardia sp. SYP-A9097 TaxID=2663237 RepID=UPI00129A8727|nr:hypothetical protein [Nocardia sp. SYP-A9097]MRH89264.1 hypothetical protein [Nocardia sp. SYP-A9097]
MNSIENTGGGTYPEPIEDDDGAVFLQWTVVAVHVDADRVAVLPIGTVVAADLTLAADQVCDRLPAPDSVPGAPYLVASACALELDQYHGRIVTVPQSSWVNRMHWAGSAWVAGAWQPAAGGLRMLDPQRWRSPELRNPL